MSSEYTKVFRQVSQAVAGEPKPRTELNSVKLGNLVSCEMLPKRKIEEIWVDQAGETFHIADRSRDSSLFPPNLVIIPSVISTQLIHHPAFIHRQTSLPNIPVEDYDAKLFTTRGWYHPDWNPTGSPYEYPIHYSVLSLFIDLTKKWCSIHGDVPILVEALKYMEAWLTA